MAKAYPMALRERIVQTYAAGGATQAEVARRFQVSTATVARLWRLYKENENFEPKPHSGGRSKQKLFAEHDAALLAWLVEEPDLTQQELADKLLESFEISIHQSSICDALKRLAYTRKKNLPR